MPPRAISSELPEIISEQSRAILQIAREFVQEGDFRRRVCAHYIYRGVLLSFPPVSVVIGAPNNLTCRAMPHSDPREMRHRAKKMQKLAETFADPELRRLILEQAHKLESLADEMEKSAKGK